MKQYRFSLDDNIRTFKDIAENNYDSIFENDYMALLKSVHDEFGTKIQLNVYYEFEGFLLSQMPDRYKAEWESVSQWLRLSFHAFSDETRYENCDYDTLRRDCELVHNEIRRFAGEKSLSYYTTLHYVACPKEGVNALRDCGIKGLVGLYGTNENPRFPYHLDDKTSAFMRENCFYKDPETGLMFMRNDICLNEYKLEEVLPVMKKNIGKEFYEVMIHEQYFYWQYPHFADRIRVAIKFLTENGYTPVFFEEMFE